MSLEQRLRAASLPAAEFDAERFAERATTEGIADVAYAHADSPLGPLLLAATPRGLACVSSRAAAQGTAPRGPRRRLVPPPSRPRACPSRPRGSPPRVPRSPPAPRAG